MKFYVVAVGRLKPGPVLALIDDYASRFRKTGRSLGFTALEFIEIDERMAHDKASQAELILKAIPEGALIWACDERGDTMKSEGFAQDLKAQADQGIGSLAIIIGGADGLDEAVLTAASRKISFGKMVWPHMLLRVMLSEQLYRAASILAGLPYHRA